MRLNVVLFVLLLSALAQQTADASMKAVRTKTYKVQKGDTLRLICGRLLGSPDRWQEIMALNPKIKNPDDLIVGDELQIPVELERYDREDLARKDSVAGRVYSADRAGGYVVQTSPVAAPVPDPAPVVAPAEPITTIAPAPEPSAAAPSVPTPPISPPAPWASWNSLIQSKTDGSVVSAPLERGEQYDIRFDLVVGAAVTKISSNPDQNLQNVLKRLRGKRPKLFAMPVLSGGELQLMSGAQPIEFPLDPQRLEARITRKEGEADLAFLQRAAAATLAIPVRARESGCAFIGVSLWTASDDNIYPATPFDFIVRRVQVGDGPKACSDDTAALMQSGLTAAFINRAGVAVDAALHIFQMPTGGPTDGPKEYSQAIYVDGKGRMLTWRLRADLASRAADPKVYFTRELRQALDFRNYEPLRTQLTGTIFPADVEAAKNALESIRSFAARSADRPVTIYASLVRSDGWPQLFPIGLVNDANGQALGSRITFIEPLRRENLTSPRCVSQWTFVLPPELLVDNGFSCPVADSGVNDGVLTDWDPVVAYLKGGTLKSDPEGLLLLAHQGNAVLSFSPSGYPGVDTNDVAHEYAAGSMGVLVACDGTSSGAAVANPNLTSKLNQLNMDVIVVSPLPIPIEVGGCFARRWRLALEEAAKKPTPMTIAEIYRSVVAGMEADLTEKDDREALNATYQFVLAGNTTLPVCRSAQ